jgi:hypothetical protein
VTPRPPVVRRLLAAGCLLALLGGCGSGTSPAESAPELGERLDQVDAAVADGDDAATRDAVRALVAASEQALAAGDIDQEQADAIRAAADGLLARLGGAGDQQTEPTEEPAEESTPAEPAPSPTPSEEDDPGKDEDKDKHKDGPGKGHGHDDDHEDDEDDD